jgi:magnesium-dependent phosphatase-1
MPRTGLVVFDADDVLFSSASDCYLGQVTLPITRVDEDTIKDSAGCKVRLNDEARTVLQELRKRGIHMSIDSVNRPHEAEEILRVLEIDRFFEHSKINFDDKGHNIIEILSDFKAENDLEISLDEVMFIDDVEQFCLDAKKALKGKGKVLQMGKDIYHLSELLKLL